MVGQRARWIALGLIVSMALSTLTAGPDPIKAQETGIDGDVYTNEDYGWSLEFDEDLWAAGDLTRNSDGYRLFLSPTSGDPITVTFDVEGNGVTDAEECQEALAEAYEAGRLEDFAPTDEYKAPETDPDAVGEVYTAESPDASIEGEAVYYLECRELEDDTLGVAMGGDADHYEDYLPAFEDLLSGLTIEDAEQDDEEQDDDSEAETGLDGNLYTDAEVGYQVEFDDSIWRGYDLFIDQEMALRLVIRDDPAYADVIIDGAFGYEEKSPEDCVEDYVDALVDGGSYSDFEAADDLSLLDTDAEADAQVYRYVFVALDDVNDEEVDDDVESLIQAGSFSNRQEDDHDEIGYIECRPAGDDAMVRVFIRTDVDSYQDETEVFEELLADIELLDAGDASDADDEERGRDDDDEQELGGSYVDPEERWSVQYDDEIWGLDEVDEPGLTGAELYPLDEDDFGFVSMLVGENGPRTALECLQNAQESFAASRVFLDFEPAAGIDEPETDEDAFNGIYTTTFAGERSEVDLIFYLECREIEDGILSIAMGIDEELFEDYLPEWERLLAGISPGDGSSGDGDDNEDQSGLIGLVTRRLLTA